MKSINEFLKLHNRNTLWTNSKRLYIYVYMSKLNSTYICLWKINALQIIKLYQMCIFVDGCGIKFIDLKTAPLYTSLFIFEKCPKRLVNWIFLTVPTHILI